MVSTSQTEAAKQNAPALQRSNAAQWPPSVLRPLSDIREITEPSLIDMVNYVKRRSAQQAAIHQRSLSKSNSINRRGSLKRNGSVRLVEPASTRGHNRATSAENGSSSYSSTPEASSRYAIPPSSVPRRSSSQAHAHGTAKTHSRKPSVRSVRLDEQTIRPNNAALPELGPRPSFTVPNHGQSQSPVKAAGLRLDPVTSDASRKTPYKTFVRAPGATDILDFPVYRHPRIKLELQASAPMFVGGGSVEGHVKITVDDNERVKSRRSLGIAAISIDLLGFEEVSGNRKATFLALGTELLDPSHPPPSSMVEPENPLLASARFWTLKPSVSAMPFLISLPLDTGPPPFQSKHANIRFLLCVTATIRDAGKHYRVRTSHDICVLATYDPEKALTSLPSPLIASDEISIQRWCGAEILKITAGLHRQVWVSGSSIFVDVHISNKTRKAVKRIDLTLERDILCYRHAAAATLEKSIGQARIFESNDRLVLARSTQRHNTDGRKGMEAYTSDTRTCELELPRGHATVRCGKYFEVRYFLIVTASLSSSKHVSVQLPIILIHMNSLDVLPNSVAQVAAAIEEKRANQRLRSRVPDPARKHSRQRSNSSPGAVAELSRRPSYSQGRAFSAPRQQSLERQRVEQTHMDNLRHLVETSPRKHPPPPHLQYPPRNPYLLNNSSTASFGNLSIGGKSSGSGSLFGSIRYHTPPAKRGARQFAQQDETGGDGLRDRLRRMHSFDSLHSKKSIATMRSRHPTQAPRKEDIRPPPRRTNSRGGMPRFHIAPHTLGLTSSQETSPDTFHPEPAPYPHPADVIVRPATSLSFREKLDRSRFEFKAVRRKASGGFRGKGKMLIERVKQREGEGELQGWI